MTPNQLFQAALQLEGSPWRVVHTDFSGQPPALEIGLEFVRGSQFHCPQCGELCGVHDTVASVSLRYRKPRKARHIVDKETDYPEQSPNQSPKWAVLR